MRRVAKSLVALPRWDQGIRDSVLAGFCVYRGFQLVCRLCMVLIFNVLCGENLQWFPFQVTASWVTDGEVEVRLVKVASDVATSAYFPASGRSSNTQLSSMEDSGGIPVENRPEESKPSVPSSAAEDYLSGLKSMLSSVGLDLTTSEPSSTRPAREENQQRRSLLAALDDEFREIAKAMWTGDNAVRFPTEEQVAATVERARDERRKRVTALMRATMATHVSENEHAYVVK